MSKVLSMFTSYNREGVNTKVTPSRPYRDGDEFIAQARAFHAIHGGDAVAIPKMKSASEYHRFVETTIRQHPGLTVLAFFGHGGTTKLLASKHHSKRHVQAFCAAVEASAGANADMDIIFYACGTGTDMDGWAAAVARLLPKARVWAHRGSGHTTRNTLKRLLTFSGVIPVVGDRGDPLWKEWVRKVRDDRSKPEYELTFWTAAKGLHGSPAIEAVRRTISAGADPNVIKAPTTQDAAYFSRMLLAAKAAREGGEMRAAGTTGNSRVDYNMSAGRQAHLQGLEQSQADAVTWRRTTMSFKSTLSKTVAMVDGKQAMSSDVW